MQYFLTRAALAAASLALIAGGLASAQSMSSAHVNSMDRTFAMQAAKGGTEEVREGQVERTSSNAHARSFAMRMIRDHGKANEQLKDVAQQLDLTSQVQDGISMAKTPEHLSGSAYLAKEVPDHVKTIALFRKEIRDGSNPQLRNFAQQTLPVLETHLRLAREYSGS